MPGDPHRPDTGLAGLEMVLGRARDYPGEGQGGLRRPRETFRERRHTGHDARILAPILPEESSLAASCRY